MLHCLQKEWELVEITPPSVPRNALWDLNCSIFSETLPEERVVKIYVVLTAYFTYKCMLSILAPKSTAQAFKAIPVSSPTTQFFLARQLQSMTCCFLQRLYYNNQNVSL